MVTPPTPHGVPASYPGLYPKTLPIMPKTSKKQNKQAQKGQKFNPVIFPRGGKGSNVPFQQEYNAKISYVTPLTLSGSAIQNYIFRLNSLFDPDYTSTGGQPYMYDQLTAIYNRYRVFSVNYKISFTNTTLDFPVVMAVTADNVTGAFASLTHACTAPFSSYDMHGPYPTQTSTGIIRGKYNIAKVLGYQANMDDDLSALVSTNPNQVVYLHLTCDSVPASESFSVQCFVKLTFRAQFYDLKQPNESIIRNPPTVTLQQLQEQLEETDSEYKIVKKDFKTQIQDISVLKKGKLK